ncbi:UDP-N-acetylglucosamine 2-epimerase [Candidatus Peregrinibacteria bacterium]|nr:MAG: UDP-N-acetylglucosamine 2-epimerase [Candidatus Peregrinibacteria bacterium]
MESRNIFILLGTRAQLIKMAPVMVELQQRNAPYQFLFTGQHQETIEDIIQNFGIKMPDKNIGGDEEIIGVFQMLLWLIRVYKNTIRKKEEFFGKTSPKDILVVHGDTISTLLGAYIGKKIGLRVAHVESGLRSFRLFHPFPEEIVRLLTFRLSNIFFCPGQWALQNLKKYRGKRKNTGHNTLLDAVRLVKNPTKSEDIIPNTKFILCSIHRFENIFHRKRFQRILEHIILLAHTFPVLFVLHPTTKNQLHKYPDLLEMLIQEKNISLRPRYDFFTFISLLKKCEFLVTDGGSNQEECFYLGKPCLLMRKKTERQEGLSENAILSEYEQKKIEYFLRNYSSFVRNPIPETISPSQKIVDFLLK